MSTPTQKVALAAGLAAVLALGAYLALRPGSSAPPASAPAARDGGPDAMTDDERRAYLAASVTVKDLALRPSLKPGTQEAVPGMLEIAGEVHNGGARPVTSVRLLVYPKDAGGQVLGTFQEELARRPLAPGESRPFRFLVPEKKEFSGQFDHELR